ncbi:MAG: DNA polymerase I [Lentisphaerae bacterium]|nr:DNA polymerase I [Lentisphaerota bacterium]
MAGDKRLFLLDGMPLLYRGHFIFMRNPRVTSKGLNTSALYGLANSVLQILEAENPTHIALVFDTSEPTFRHVRYPAYKAQREAMPEDIARAIPMTSELAEALRLPMLRCPGFEADDIIGTLAARAETEGFTTYMVTPDKDFAQLVTAHTKLYRPGKSTEPPEILDVPAVLAKWGLQRVDQMIDLLGLAGDATDNIPGVPGVGEKTALKLLHQFGSLEAVLAGTAQLKGKQKESLEQFAEQARLSRELATISRDAPVAIGLEALARAEPDRARLSQLLREWEFVSLGKRLLGEAFSLVSPGAGAGSKGEPPRQAMQGELVLESEVEGGRRKPATAGPGAATEASPEDEPEAAAVADGAEAGTPAEPPMADLKSIRDVAHTYELVDSDTQRHLLVARLLKASTMCFDTETTGLDVRHSRLVGLSFSLEPGAAFYVPVPADPGEAQRVLAMFQPVFANPAIEKSGHNLKFDMGVLRAQGIAVAGPLFDTMLAHYVIEPEQRHNMDHLARCYLRYSPIPITDLIGEKGKDQRTMADVEVGRVAEYAAEDADVTLQLRGVLEPLVRERGAERALAECENPLIPVLVDMETEGIRIDSGALAEYSEVLQRDMATLEAEIFKEAGTRFNISSPKQLGDVLFDYMKIAEKPKKTRTGQYMTNEEVLARLAATHRIAELVLEFRMCQKLKSTYVDTLPLAVARETGRVHTTYNQAVTATGRMQSQNPNLQNIPIRTERGREIRKAFVPRGKEYLLLSADYSQIELRVVAELSGDEALRQTFRDGLDVHAATAARVNGVPLKEVTPEMRRQAKMVNFGIIYGISAFGLAQRLRIARTDAARIIDAYFQQYPDIKRYMDVTIEFARQEGYVRTLMGRRRLLPDINSRNGPVRQAAERNAINTPIQGTAADMIKLAMIRIHRALAARNLKTRMLLQVHDELVFDLYRDEEADVRELVGDCMRTAIPMAVPIVVDMGVGENWLEAH